MKMIMMITSQLILNLMLQSLFVSNEAKARELHQACSSSENWNFESRNSPNWSRTFRLFLIHQDSPWNSFSEAIQLRKMSQLMSDGSFEADFSEYWIGRVFYSLKLYPLALGFFESSERNTSHQEIRSASKECIRMVSMKIPDWNHSAHELNNVASIHLSRALEALQRKDHSSALAELNLELQDPRASVDLIHLLLGRTYYTIKNYPEAIRHFQKINRRSNLIIEGLTDLSWAYLLNQNAPEALGIAIQLRSGTMRNTFSPESLMVAAMALNETCSYPDAVKMIQYFIKDYQSSYEWLTLNDSKSVNAYEEILLGLRQQSTVPSKIRTEWSRLSAFQTRQEEINLLIENSRIMTAIPEKVKRHKEDLAKKQSALIQKLIQDLQKPVQSADSREKLAKRVLQAKREVRRIIRLTQSMKVLMNALKKYEATIPAEKARMVGKINSDLKKRNSEMLALLKRIRENIDLVEVEVYHGASRDLLKAKSNSKTAENAPKQEGTLAWNWGRFSVADLDQLEVWEDELGSMKADLESHCQ